MMNHDVKKRGTKRKRYEAPKQRDLGAKVAGKLHHDLKEVRKAAKKAKTFETQKLVKKLKGLRLKDTNDQDINECETQLQQLKIISPEAIANTALRTKLTKDKLLSNNEPLQAAISQELANNVLPPATGGTAAAKIQNRLLSSKILAMEVAAAVEDLRAVVHPVTDLQDVDIDLLDSKPERKKLKKTGNASGDDEDVDMDLEGEVEAGREDPVLADDEDDEGWESGTVGDDEKEPDDEWESGSLSDGSERYMDEDGDEEEGSVSSVRKAPIAGPSRTKSKAGSGQSTFLPSLSTGFIRGSDSDWSESEAKITEIEQKKNRRGQRARQAIWEKKYGRNANHKKKEAAENERGRKRWPTNSSTSYVQRSGRPLNQDKHGVHRPSRKAADETDARARDQRSDTVTRSNVDGGRDQRPLHPSWEAKKKLKEKQSMAFLPQAPPGRKIKFS